MKIYDLQNAIKSEINKFLLNLNEIIDKYHHWINNMYKYLLCNFVDVFFSFYLNSMFTIDQTQR